jgi:hypothetical protein
MEIMQTQYLNLSEALAGYVKTGVPLIAYHGTTLKPAGLGDDIGIYYFIPKIAYSFGISINQSLNIFFSSMILISLCLGIIGCYILLNKTWIKWLGIAEMTLLACMSYFYLETVYFTLFSIPLAIIPLFLSFSKHQKLGVTFKIFLVFSGLAIGIANHLRSHAGTGVLIFLLIILLFYLQSHWKQKIILMTLVFIGFLSPILYFDMLLDRRDMYLTNYYPNYESAPRRHVFWHSVYIGFGYLNNEYGIKYKDEVAIEKVHSISPQTAYVSKEYEEILRAEIYKLIKTHPLFAAQTIFAKFGVIFFYLLIFGNVGLIAIFRVNKNWYFEIAFWSAMTFNSFFGILATPDYRYLMGFIAFATLYGIISIDEAIESTAWRKMITVLQHGREKS